MASKSSTWQTVDPEDQFEGTSLKKRAEKRTVEVIGARAWVVNGESKLGDAYPSYSITLPVGEQKYVCSCYSHGNGQIRRRKMCSHVLAVILYRKTHADMEPEIIVDEIPETVVKKITWEAEPVDVERKTSDPVIDEAPSGRGAARGGGVEGPGAKIPEYVLAVLNQDEIDALTQELNAVELPDEPMLPTDERLGSPPLPDKFTEFRLNQWDAITECVDHLKDGVKVVMLSAPTGSGKTVIGETVKRLMGARSPYCCTTKSLQDQIQREFGYADVIKGRSNYPTESRPDLTAEDCTGTQANGYECDWCADRSVCPYQIAKEKAVMSPLPVLNIAYFLGETSSSLGSKFLNRPLVIIDEADTIEEQLMSSIEIVIGANLRRSLGVHTIPKKTVPGDWARWLEEQIVPAIKRKQTSLRGEARTLYGTNVDKMRQVKKLKRLLDRIKPLIEETEDGRAIEDGWVMTGYEGSKESEATIRFKPIRVNSMAHDKLWNRGGQFLLMSATLISPAQMAEDLGLEDNEWEVVHVESVFPVERRPVFINDGVSMTAKTKDTAWPKMVKLIDDVLDDNTNVRVLVHTVSYALTKYINENSRNAHRMMRYNDARERERVLSQYLEFDDSVLLAPSFERGIDLPKEDCEIIIIAKVPYPYLGDKQISARMYGRGGKTWYAVQTIRSIAQMTGRGMRSADDWCDTYVLDSQFKRLFREQRRLFPSWWRDALVLSSTDPKYKPLIKAAKKRRENRDQNSR